MVEMFDLLTTMEFPPIPGQTISTRGVWRIVIGFDSARDEVTYKRLGRGYAPKIGRGLDEQLQTCRVSLADWARCVEKAGSRIVSTAPLK